jgi:hypothetical protein
MDFTIPKDKGEFPMRSSLPAKPRLMELFGARRVVASPAWPDRFQPGRGPRIETALEAQFRTVESLLDALDFLAGAAARRRSRRRRR